MYSGVDTVLDNLIPHVKEAKDLLLISKISRKQLVHNLMINVMGCEGVDGKIMEGRGQRLELCFLAVNCRFWRRFRTTI